LILSAKSFVPDTTSQIDFVKSRVTLWLDMQKNGSESRMTFSTNK